MGTEITEEEPIYGNDCLQCFPEGKTPKYFYVMFFDMVKGDHVDAMDPPNGHLFKLQQAPPFNCTWGYGTRDVWWQVALNPYITGNWQLGLWDTPGNKIFWAFHPNCPYEHEVFVNRYLNGDSDYGGSGQAIIFTIKPAVDLIEALGLSGDPKILMEFFLTDTGDPVYKFCSSGRSYNIKVRVTP